MGLDEKYEGQEEPDGEMFLVEHDDGPRPFTCVLDVGLVRTTTGNRVFGALKGACDGGLNIPHKTKRFPGTRVTKAEVQTNKRGKAVDVEKAKTSFDAAEHREHIFGIHVEEYYEMLKKDKPDVFRRQFSQWTKALNGKSFEEYYTAVHAAIRKSPARANSKKPRSKPKAASTKTGYCTYETKGAKNAAGKPARNGGKWISFVRLTHAQRAERVQAKMVAIQQEVMA